MEPRFLPGSGTKKLLGIWFNPVKKELALHPNVSQFYKSLEAATDNLQVWAALHRLYADTVGVKLFTVTSVDMEHKLARRCYTSHPDDYPVSGTKPIDYNKWFDIVHGQRRTFVANTIKDIAAVFPDHEKIWSLGCGSVVNLPAVIAGELAATINLLDQEHFYTKEKVDFIEQELAQPSLLACQRVMTS